MSTNYKNTKRELIAIYKLEFYKKQKKWKLCHDEKKKNTTKEQPVKVVLNETYSIQSAEPVVEPPAPLNDAFIIDESEQPSLTHQPKLPSPRPRLDEKFNMMELEAHEHSIWHDTDNDWMTPIEPCHQRSYIEPIQQYTSEWWPGPVGGPPDPSPGEWVPADYGLDPGYDWQPAGKVHSWSVPEPYSARDLCRCGRLQLPQECCPLAGEPAYEVPAAGVHPVLAADVLSPDQDELVDWESSRWADSSVDSSWSFIRGAHLAPHSSELELRPFTMCSCVVEDGHLPGLPPAQLAASMAHHAQLLRKLLREQQARDKHTQHAPYKPPSDMSHELPTRDPGLSLPQSPPPLEDPFVAGSFLQACAPGGRGRGRRLIGIGMGRPYRL